MSSITYTTVVDPIEEERARAREAQHALSEQLSAARREEAALQRRIGEAESQLSEERAHNVAEVSAVRAEVAGLERNLAATHARMRDELEQVEGALREEMEEELAALEERQEERLAATQRQLDHLEARYDEELRAREAERSAQLGDARRLLEDVEQRAPAAMAAAAGLGLEAEQARLAQQIAGARAQSYGEAALATATAASGQLITLLMETERRRAEMRGAARALLGVVDASREGLQAIRRVFPKDARKLTAELKRLSAVVTRWDAADDHPRFAAERAVICEHAARLAARTSGLSTHVPSIEEQLAAREAQVESHIAPRLHQSLGGFVHEFATVDQPDEPTAPLEIRARSGREAVSAYIELGGAVRVDASGHANPAECRARARAVAAAFHGAPTTVTAGGAAPPPPSRAVPAWRVARDQLTAILDGA